MYADCAEKILSVYQNDPSHCISGVQASLASSAPQTTTIDIENIERKIKAPESPLAVWVSKNLKSLWQNVLLMKAENLFIPYRGIFSEKEHSLLLPENVFFKTLFHGCRMSFRKEILESVLFDSDLVRYSAGEDLDFSYRAGTYGALVEATSAKLYHHTANSGRLSRLNVSKMGAYNTALFIYKHSELYKRDVKQYKKLFARRLVAEFLKDILTLRYTFPQLRGVWKGSLLGMKLLKKPRHDQNVINTFKQEFI